MIKQKSYTQSVKKKRLIVKIITYVLIFVFSISFLLPFIWMLSTSFKEYEEIFTIPVTFIPKKFITFRKEKVKCLM